MAKSKKQRPESDAGHKAGARKSRAKKSTTTQAAPETPAALEQVPVKTRPSSIRQTIVACLGEGMETAKIAEVLKEQFPDSAAAAKSGKHIAFYKSQLKKQTAKTA